MFTTKYLFVFFSLMASSLVSMSIVDAQSPGAGDWNWKGKEASAASRVSGMPSNGRILGIAGNQTNVRIQVDGAMRSIPGELIKIVSPGGVAERSGLKRGDVIVKWDGKYVGHDGELPRLIRESRGPGPFKVKIVRDGRFKVMSVHFEAPRRATPRREGVSQRAPKPDRRANTDKPIGAVLPEATLPQTKSKDIDAEIEDILSD